MVSLREIGILYLLHFSLLHQLNTLYFPLFDPFLYLVSASEFLLSINRIFDF